MNRAFIHSTRSSSSSSSSSSRSSSSSSPPKTALLLSSRSGLSGSAVAVFWLPGFPPAPPSRLSFLALSASPTLEYASPPRFASIWAFEYRTLHHTELHQQSASSEPKMRQEENTKSVGGSPTHPVSSLSSVARTLGSVVRQRLLPYLEPYGCSRHHQHHTKHCRLLTSPGRSNPSCYRIVPSKPPVMAIWHRYVNAIVGEAGGGLLVLF